MHKKYFDLLIINFFLVILVSSCSTSNISNFKKDNNGNKLKFLTLQLKSLPEFNGESVDEYEKKINSVLDHIVLKKSESDFLASELFLKASDASFRGDAKFSSMFYKQLLKLKPKNKSLQKKYAIELIRSGEISKSRPLIESLVYPKITDQSLALVLGGIYTALGDNIKARKIYKTIWNKFKTVDSCVFLSKNLIRTNQKRKGLSTLKSCSKQVKNPEFNYLIGQFYIKEKKYNLAKKYFLKSLKINKNFDKSAISYGLILESKELFKQAISFYKKFLKLNPNSYSINSRLVQLLFVNNYGKQIIPFAENLVSLDPDDLNTKVKLGILYTDNNDFEKAKGIFKEILAAAPTSDKVLYYIAALSQQTGDSQDALEYFHKIAPESGLYLDSNIQISNILKKLAIRERESGNHQIDFQYQKFIQFTKVQKNITPKIKVNLVLNLVTFYENINLVDKAILELVKIKNNPDFKESQRFYLASLYDKQKNHKKSDQIIHLILEKNPENADALNFLGYSYLEREIEPKLALKYLNAAHKLKPKSGYILDSLGWYHFKQGNLKKALEFVRLAWKYERQDVVIAKHLALIYQKFKDYTLAKRYYIEALKNCSNLKEKKQIIFNIDQLEKLRLPASEQ